MISIFVRGIIGYDPWISEVELSKVVGLLANGMMIGQDLPANKYTNLVEESDVRVGQIPRSRIIKMGKKEHIDNFFTDGSLFLGNALYYGAYDHGEIGDYNETSVTVIARSMDRTIVVDTSPGFNNHIFCCYAGDPDEKCIADFGYDSFFEIVDVPGFAKAIADCLKAENHTYALCAYAKYKNIVVYTSSDIDPSNFSANNPILQMGRLARNFVKPSRYSHQNEFRFIWDSDDDLHDPTIIKCPAAVQFCRR